MQTCSCNIVERDVLLELEPVKKLRLGAVAVWLRGTVVASSHNSSKI